MLESAVHTRDVDPVNTSYLCSFPIRVAFFMATETVAHSVFSRILTFSIEIWRLQDFFFGLNFNPFFHEKRQLNHPIGSLKFGI